MRRVHLQRLLPIFTMFLIAPPAWAYSPERWRLPSEPPENYASMQQRLGDDCAREMGGQFAAWSRLTAHDARTLGDALCAEARVFWPFVEVREPESFAQLSGLVEVEAPRALVLGVATGSVRDNSEVLHALRHALYPASAMLWRWNDNPAAFGEWISWIKGGRLGGVIYAVIDGGTPEQVAEQVDRAGRAVAYVNDPANGMSEYTLVIDNRVPGLDLGSRVAVQRWLALSPRGCQADL